MEGNIKPKSVEELIELRNSGDIEIMIAEDLGDGTTRFLICDLRCSYEEGEIYELILGAKITQLQE